MKKLLIPGLLLSAMIMSSCEDKVFSEDFGGEPLAPGSEIPFGVGLEPGQSQSRTVYGNETTDKNNNRVFPIYWKHSPNENELDSILIQSPHAEANNRKGKYRVKPSDATYSGYSAVIKADESSEGVVLGNGAHSFYGFYPYGQLIDTQTVEAGTTAPDADPESRIYGEMPSVQRVDCPVQPNKDNVYEAVYNMDYCFMTAVRHNVIPKLGQPVQLRFKPWSTVIDINLPGPSTADEAYTVTDIVIRSLPSSGVSEGNAPKITGTFRYDFDKTDEDGLGTITFQNLTGSTGLDSRHEPSNLLTVHIYNSDGTKGVLLKQGQSIRLKAFMLPVTDVTGIKVEVYASGNKVWSATLRTPDGRNNLLTPGSIHNVGLPNVQAPYNDDYSSWMTELSDDLLVTQLSIPGSYDSFTWDRKFEYNPDGSRDPNEYKIQQNGITSQFNAGIRAFNARVKVFEGDDPYMPGITGKHLGIT